MQATHAVWPGTQAPLPGSEAALIGLAALTVVMIPFLWPPANQLKSLLVAFAGYLGPSGFRLGAAKLIETGHASCVPWIAAVLLVPLLSLVRRSFGVVSVPAAIALLAVVIRYASTP